MSIESVIKALVLAAVISFVLVGIVSLFSKRIKENFYSFIAVIGVVLTILFTVTPAVKIDSGPVIDVGQTKTDPPEPPSPEPPEIINTISFGRKEDNKVPYRDYKDHYFMDTDTMYNRLSEVVYDCVGCSFKYSSTSEGVCTGIRDVYVRNETDELNNNYDGWIHVGEFEYDNEGSEVTVKLKWDPVDVYAIAAIRRNHDSNTKYHANWGDEVTLYYYGN